MEEKLTRRRGEYPRPVGVCARYGRSSTAHVRLSSSLPLEARMAMGYHG